MLEKLRRQIHSGDILSLYTPDEFPEDDNTAFHFNCKKCNNMCSGCPPGALIDKHGEHNVYHEMIHLPPEYRCPRFEPRKSMEEVSAGHRAQEMEMWDAIVAFKEGN